MTQYTAKKVYIQDAEGNYCVPYVNPADADNLGVIKPDGDTITTGADGTISTNNSNLRAITAYSNNGELLTDAQGLEDVTNYAHSTFDKSKFTIVGSPNITNDGVVSGFNYSNHLRLPYSVVAPLENGSWRINFEGKMPSEAGKVFGLCGASSDYATTRIAIGNINGGNNFFLEVRANDNTKVDIYVASAVSQHLNQEYIGYASFDGVQTYNLALSFDNGATWLNANAGTFAKKVSFNNEPLEIATCVATGTTAEFDMKYFEIISDGIPIFSGNKTGIDTIKPDDYTVVGSPTITADGIISNITSSNGIYEDTTIPFSTANSWDIEFDVNYKNNSTFQRAIETANGEPSVIFQIGSNGWASLYLSSNGINYDIASNYSLGMYFEDGKKYNVKISFTGTDYRFYFNKTEITSVRLSSTAKVHSSKLGIFTSGSFPMAGEQDLNTFKIYVDGNLVYQPCLKIPYTESKTGSKVVDAIYRDRVNDMAEQFGFAPYYTLSDTDFTLPQVELYGLIGQRTLRDNYRNGINYWELYSNRDLEQGGSCTSGVEVTFARPFADTNYVLSVPYSAKSTTAFTPTQTGDWIAKGKGIL